jgi:hypothetical protein
LEFRKNSQEENSNAKKAKKGVSNACEHGSKRDEEQQQQGWKACDVRRGIGPLDPPSLGLQLSLFNIRRIWTE